MAKDDEAGAVEMGFLAHDLRGPLTAVQLNAQLIERAAVAAGREKEQRWAALIAGAARRMDGLLRQLVEAERLRLGQLKLARDPVAWDQLWRDVLAQDPAVLGPDRIRLALSEEHIVVSGDCERLGRAIHGLLCVATQAADGVVAIEVTARNGEVVSAIRAPRAPARAAVAAAPPAPGIALYFARTVFECHGGSVRLGKGNPWAVDFELVLPTSAATSART